jgi:hypothetical protein
VLTFHNLFRRHLPLEVVAVLNGESRARRGEGDEPSFAVHIVLWDTIAVAILRAQFLLGISITPVSYLAHR